MTIAHLGLAVDSGPVAAATPALQKMTAAANQAEVAAANLARSTAGTSATMQKMVAVLESMERDLTVLTHHVVTAEKAFNGLGAGAVRAGGMMNNALMQQRNLMFQLVDIGQGIPLLFQAPAFGLLNLGNQFAQVGQAYYGQGGLGAALKDMSSMLGGFASRLAPAAAVIGVLTAGFAAMTTEINRTARTHVSVGDVVGATWQLAAERIIGFMQPAIDWLAGIWDLISPGIDFAMNMLIGSFDLALRNIGTIWSGLPAALGDVTIQTANAVIKGTEDMINGAIKLLNDFTAGAREALKGLGIDVGEVGPVNFGPGLANPFAGKNAELNNALTKNAADVRTKSLEGGYTADIGARAQEIARARAEMEGLDSTTQSAADSAGLLGQSMEDAAKLAQQEWEFYRQTFSGFLEDLRQGLMSGESVWESFRSAAVNALDSIASRLLDLATNNIFNSLFGGFGTIMGGAPMPSGGFIPGITGPKLFAAGGYTGDMGTGESAGVVHGQEFVVNASATRRFRPALEAMNNGGGVAAAAPSPVNIYNYTGAPVETKQNPAGGIDVLIGAVERRVKENMGRGQYKQFGVSPGMRRT